MASKYNGMGKLVYFQDAILNGRSIELIVYFYNFFIDIHCMKRCCLTILQNLQENVKLQLFALQRYS